MNIKGVIFALDGVICSNDELHYRAWKALADRLNIHFDREINHKISGLSRMESLEVVLAQASNDYTAVEKEAFAAEKNAFYADSLRKMSKDDVAEDVVDTLNTLKEKGVKIAVASSSRNAPTILEKIGLEDMFDAVCDGNGISKPKPDPEVFLKAAESLGLTPDECLVVEDSVTGISAGKVGGFAAAGIGEAAECEAADYRINRASDVLALI